MSDSNWFLSIGYKFERNAVNPVTLRSKAYAVASPYNGGAWHVFANKKEVEQFKKEWTKNHA